MRRRFASCSTAGPPPSTSLRLPSIIGCRFTSLRWWTLSQPGTNAMLQSWDGLQGYAFPPFGLLSRVLAKVRQSKGLESTLITPFWPQHPWFPDLLELLVEIPSFLPHRRDLLKQPHFHHYPQNLPVLQLTAWRISSDPRFIPTSLRRWLATYPLSSTLHSCKLPGEVGLFIVPGAIVMVILFLGPLWLRWPTFFSTSVVLSLSLSYSSIASYRSMLSGVFRFILPELSSHFVLHDLLCSFRLERLLPASRVPLGTCS